MSDSAIALNVAKLGVDMGVVVVLKLPEYELDSVMKFENEDVFVSDVAVVVGLKGPEYEVDLVTQFEREDVMCD